MAYATEQLNFNSMQSAVVKSIFEESEVLYSTWQKKTGHFGVIPSQSLDLAVGKEETKQAQQKQTCTNKPKDIIKN